MSHTVHLNNILLTALYYMFNLDFFDPVNQPTWFPVSESEVSKAEGV